MIEPYPFNEACQHFAGLHQTATLLHSRGNERGTALLEVLDAIADSWGGAACSFRRFDQVDPATRQILYRLMESRGLGTVNAGTFSGLINE